MSLMPTSPEHVDVDGESVRYHHAGVGPPVVLLHGLGGASDVWYRNVPALAARYHVIAPDLWGPGRYRNQRLTLDAGVSFLLGFIDELQRTDAHLVGSSLGVLIAGTASVRHPERVRSLALVDSAGLGRHIAWSQRLMTVPGVGELFFRPTMGRVRSMLRLLVRGGPVDDEMAQALYEASLEPGVLRLMLRALREGVTLRGVKRSAQLLPALARFAKPVMVMWGSEDPLFPVRHAQAAAQELGARCEVFDGVGHWP